MGKMKKQVPDSKQLPVVPVVHDAFISKNKKRKEKRHSLNLTAKKVETGDFIPVKRNSLKPTQVAGLSQKGKAQLSTSLPIKGSNKGKGENANHSFAVSAPIAKQEKKVAGILSNPNTPKRKPKNEHVTFELAPKTKYIVEEATVRNKKLINKKGAKPPPKDKGKQPPVESSDDSDDDDFGAGLDDYLDMESDESDNENSNSNADDDNDSVEGDDFLDMEAEESEDENGNVNADDDEDSEDDDQSGDEEYLSSFLNDESESDEDNEDDEDEDEDDEDEDDSGDDDDEVENDSDGSSPLKPDTPKLTGKKPKNTELDSKKKSLVPEISTTPAKKGKLAEQDSSLPAKKGKLTEQNSSTPAKKGKLAEQNSSTKPDSLASAEVKKGTEPKFEQKNKKQKPVKPEEPQVIEKIEKKKVKTEETEVVKKEKFVKPSNFVGFIRKVPKTVTEKDIKSAVCKIVAAKVVLQVVLVRARQTNEQNAFVYLKDATSLGNLVHKKIELGDSSCVIYRAKSSAEENSAPKPVAFLPRVPQWITEAELKEAVEKQIGVGKVMEVIEKKVNRIAQTKNILLSFVDTDALKKAIERGAFVIKDHSVVIREALEGVQIAVHRAVLANVPEKATEATVKKIVEASVGKDTVVSVRFSFKKKSYAFIMFKDEATMKKALTLGDTLSIKGSQVQVRPYLPRKPRKRAPPNEHAKVKAAQKRKRQSPAKTDDDQGQAGPKKQKTEVTSSVPKTTNSPSPNEAQTAKKKKNKNKRKKPGVSSPSGQVKATKNVKTPKQKVSKPSHVPSPAQDKKISSLKNKIQAKKEKFQGQKSKSPKKGKK